MRVIQSEQKRNSSVTTFDGGWSYRKARKKPNSVTMLYNSHKINKTSKQECVCVHCPHKHKITIYKKHVYAFSSVLLKKVLTITG